MQKSREEGEMSAYSSKVRAAKDKVDEIKCKGLHLSAHRKQVKPEKLPRAELKVARICQGEVC